MQFSIECHYKDVQSLDYEFDDSDDDRSKTGSRLLVTPNLVSKNSS